MTSLPDHLPIAAWMAAAPTRAVIGALEAAGGAGCARFVGGCVRNALLDRAIDDIDIATTLTPQAVMAALQAAHVKFAPTGVEHGTVTAIAAGRPYEVTSLRRDVETDGRRAVVAFTTDWGEDAQRRDFRLNALYMDAEGRLYDPTGAGVRDALAGRIVFVGDPATRIREDYLRILRFFRFRAWFGRGEPDPAGLEACAALKEGLERLSAERVSKELLKLLAAADPRPAMGEMAAIGALAVVLPEVRTLERLTGIVEVQGALGSPDAALRLAALLPADPVAVAAAAARLRLSNAQRDRLVAAAAPDPQIRPGLDPAAVRRKLYAVGAETFRDQVELAWASQPEPGPGAGENASAWAPLLDAARTWSRPKFPLSGHDAARAGLPQGPRMGQALRAAESWWIAEDFRPDRAALLERLRREP
jgi:poly(A) polymerase